MNDPTGTLDRVIDYLERLDSPTDIAGYSVCAAGLANELRALQATIPRIEMGGVFEVQIDGAAITFAVVGMRYDSTRNPPYELMTSQVRPLPEMISASIHDDRTRGGAR